MPEVPYTMRQQPQRGPHRDRGAGRLDEAEGSRKREREGGIDLEELVDWRPKGQTVDEGRPQKRLRLDRETPIGAQGYGVRGRGVAGEAALGTGWQTGGAVTIGDRYRVQHRAGQGVAGEAEIGAGRRRGSRLGIGPGIGEQGVAEQWDSAGIG